MSSTYTYFLNQIDKRIEHDILDKSWGETYYVRKALRMTNQMFKWKNLPKTIPARIIEQYLQTCGQIAFTQVGEDYYVFFGSAGGVPDVYYEPTEFIVANPGLNYNKSLKIGEDCVLIRNDSYYMGLLPTIERTAKQLVENDISILDAQWNLRIQALLVAQNDNAKKSAETYLKRVKEGEVGIILAKSMNDDGISTKPYSSAGQTNNITQLIELQQYLKASLYGELGINANFNMKREALNSAESELNKDALLPLVDDMLAMRKMACEEINAKYGLNIDVEKNSSWELHDEETDGIIESDAESGDETTEEITNEEPVEESVEETTDVEETTEEVVEDNTEPESVAEELVEAIEQIVEDVIEEKEVTEDVSE